MKMRTILFVALSGLLLIPAIPSQAQTGAETNTVDAWKRKIVIQLASKKQFPPEAWGEGGTATVKFAFDRQGKLISTELVESSGSKLLDAAALRMVESAAPFPEPPAEVKDDRLSFTLPVVFRKGKLLPWAGEQAPAEWVEEQRKVDAKIRGICRGC